VKRGDIWTKIIAVLFVAAALLTAWVWDGGARRVAGPAAGSDLYRADAAPARQPRPAEPVAATGSGEEFSCFLSVRCDTVLSNLALLAPEKREMVPADGVIFPAAEVTFHEGESVFDLLRREMRLAGIHMEFTNVPLYNSAYIEGINNFYEFDAGELSGWMYKVNGWFPNYGCSRYLLRAGDEVEWIYTCDLGADIGGGGAVTGP
jgi:hypothetical protein